MKYGLGRNGNSFSEFSDRQIATGILHPGETIDVDPLHRRRLDLNFCSTGADAILTAACSDILIQKLSAGLKYSYSIATQTGNCKPSSSDNICLHLPVARPRAFKGLLPDFHESQPRLARNSAARTGCHAHGARSAVHFEHIVRHFRIARAEPPFAAQFLYYFEIETLRDPCWARMRLPAGLAACGRGCGQRRNTIGHGMLVGQVICRRLYREQVPMARSLAISEDLEIVLTASPKSDHSKLADQIRRASGDRRRAELIGR